jgi:poly-gamma-glutamate capsule biosynthesis protein CapA/YwtB (metallophosphatase superfamily)
MSEAIRIVITGDTHLGGGRVRDAALNRDAEQLFGEFLPLIREADLAITNLESPLIENGIPIPKTGPNLKSPAAAVGVLKDAGFDLVTLANNHIMDFGQEGLFSTIEACHIAGIETAGAGKSLEEAQKPYVCEIRGTRLAIINIAENEFGTTQNGAPGCHPLNPVQNYYVINEAASRADRVIVIVHGGHEHYELPSPRMKETYRFFADAGADAVVAHHTHCISGYELYNNTPIFYSLGNFLFDSKTPFSGTVTPWHTGLIAELKITKNNIDFELHPFVQNAENSGLRPMKTDEKKYVEKKIGELNTTIQDDEKLEQAFAEYCNRVNRMYTSYIEPHSIRLVHALRNRNLLPSMLSGRKKRLLLNLTRCEAHRDVLIKTLTT